MQVERSQSPFETTSLIQCPNPPPYHTPVSNTYTIPPNDNHDFDEAANWIELESKKRSVRYHLSECIKYQSFHHDMAFATPIYDNNNNNNNTIISYNNEAVSTDKWRVKVASDMAVSGLLAITHILDLLYENGKRAASIIRDLTMWSLLMSASYAIRTLHYSPPLDTTAHATLLLSSCLTLRSTCQLFHIGIRTLVISRCQNIVTSIHGRILAGVTIDQHDVDSLHHFWFRGLSLFRVEEEKISSTNVGREVEAPRGWFMERSLPASGYVIPEDD